LTCNSQTCTRAESLCSIDEDSSTESWRTPPSMPAFANNCKSDATRVATLNSPPTEHISQPASSMANLPTTRVSGDLEAGTTPDTLANVRQWLAKTRNYRPAPTLTRTESIEGGERDPAEPASQTARDLGGSLPPGTRASAGHQMTTGPHLRQPPVLTDTDLGQQSRGSIRCAPTVHRAPPALPVHDTR